MTLKPDESEKLFTMLEDISTKQDALDRSLNGDKDNKTEGLRDIVMRHDAMLKPVEYSVKIATNKFFWYFCGAVELLLETNHVGIVTTIISFFRKLIPFI